MLNSFETTPDPEQASEQESGDILNNEQPDQPVVRESTTDIRKRKIEERKKHSEELRRKVEDRRAQLRKEAYERQDARKAKLIQDKKDYEERKKLRSSRA